MQHKIFSEIHLLIAQWWFLTEGNNTYTKNQVTYLDMDSYCCFHFTILSLTLVQTQSKWKGCDEESKYLIFEYHFDQIIIFMPSKCRPSFMHENYINFLLFFFFQVYLHTLEELRGFIKWFHAFELKYLQFPLNLNVSYYLGRVSPPTDSYPISNFATE